MTHDAKSVPSLPSNDPAAAARAEAITRAREAYVYDWSYASQPFAKVLPKWEEFGPAYMTRGAEIQAQLTANHGAYNVEAAAGRILGKVASEVSKLAHELMHDPVAEATSAQGSVEPWLRMFPLMRSPLALKAWREDWCFGWQRIAGPCPVVLKRLDRLPAYLPVTDAELASAVGDPSARVHDALAAGRLYVADYEMFAGLQPGVTDGHKKYLWAPVALFCANARGLSPVAIQLGGHDGGRDTYVTPASGARWLLARTAVQAMDESHQGALTHVGWCHMIIQRVIFAAHRQLAPVHPIAVLLAPHLENTLAVNQYARQNVLSVNGSQDRLLAPTIEDQIKLMAKSVDAIDLASLDPTIDFARRGVGDAGALPAYPFRDDGLPLWEATRAFIAQYVALYYASDADVATDTELRAFVAEIGAADGGRLPNLVAGVRVATVDDVVQLLSRVVYRATTYHAAINDSSYDWVSVAPNMPSAAFGPIPAAGAPIGADAFASMLPPIPIAFEVISSTYNVAELGTNRIGQYPAGTFVDPRVGPLVAQFQARLRDIEKDTNARNAQRPLPYEFLIPSRVTASINA